MQKQGFSFLNSEEIKNTDKPHRMVNSAEQDWMAQSQANYNVNGRTVKLTATVMG